MGFSEQQQEIIKFIQHDDSVKDDFLEMRSTIEYNFDPEVSQENKDRELWNVTKELFEKAIEKKDEEALALQQTYQSLNQQEQTHLQNQIEQEPSQSYTFLSLLEKNTTVYNIMKSMVEQSGNTIEQRSQSIEHVRGQFALANLSPELKQLLEEQPSLHQNMKTGLSLYFTHWLNGLSAAQIKEVANIGGGLGGIISKASDLMGIFKNLTSFQGQMKSINTIIDGMDIYSHQLLQPGSNHINQLTAFSSPEQFARLLQRHTPAPRQQPSGTILSFNQLFDINGTPDMNPDRIIAGLEQSYTPQAHQLMEKVHKFGPQILEQRESLTSTFGEVYAQLSQSVSSFGFLLGDKPLSEHLEGTWLGNITNFVCKLLGLGSLKNIEKKGIMKEFVKNCPKIQQDSIASVLGEISTNVSNEKYTRHNPFEKDLQGGDPEINKKIITELPNKHLLVDSIKTIHTDKGFFFHPTLLQKAGRSDLLVYYIKNESTNTYTIDPNRVSEYQQKLSSSDVDIICDRGRKDLLAPSIISTMIDQGKTTEHLTTYLVSGLSFPDYALDIASHHLIYPIYNTKKVDKKKQQQVDTLTQEITTLEQEIQSIEEEHERIIKNNNGTLTENQKKELQNKKEELKKKQQLLNEIEGKKQEFDTEEHNKINFKKSKKITRKDAIDKYGSTPAIRNFNPGNIMDTGFGGKKINGERFTVFDSPQEGVEALVNKIKNIQNGGSTIYQPTMTLQQYINTYAPSHENNTQGYIEDICKELNITEDTVIKDIDAESLAIAHTKKEDIQSYKMLKDLSIIV